MNALRRKVLIPLLATLLAANAQESWHSLSIGWGMNSTTNLSVPSGFAVSVESFAVSPRGWDNGAPFVSFVSPLQPGSEMVFAENGKAGRVLIGPCNVWLSGSPGNGSIAQATLRVFPVNTSTPVAGVVPAGMPATVSLQTSTNLVDWTTTATTTTTNQPNQFYRVKVQFN